MSLGERPRGSARPTPNEHYNSLPRTSIEGALATASATSPTPTSSPMEDSSPFCEAEGATADGASAFEETPSLPGASRNLTLKVRRKNEEGALNWTGYRERCREANHGPQRIPHTRPRR